jgi:hypothetical protein
MFGFRTAAQKLVIAFLKAKFGKVWKEKWSLLSPVWDSLMASTRDNMAAGTFAFFENVWIFKNENDSFADTEKEAKWYRGYSIPRTYLRQRVEDEAYQRNMKIDEFVAAQLSPDIVRQLTSLVFDLNFVSFLQKRKGEKIGQSEYYLLDIMEEAYRVESETPVFTMMVKVGSPGSDPDGKKLLKAWEHRNKSTPARYKPGSFYAAKLAK